MEAGPVDEHSPPGQPGWLARGFVAGTVGGAVAGTADVLASLSAHAQFLPGWGEPALLVLHVAALCALVGALLGTALTGLALLFLRHTLLGPLLRHALARHAEARARGPEHALVGVSLVLTFVPFAGLALAAAFALGQQTILVRHHKGLVVAVVMFATLASLALALLSAVLLARPVELLLRRVARGRAARALSHPAAPPALLTLLVALGCAAAAFAARDRLALDQLHLRPFVVTLGLLVAAAAAWPLAPRLLFLLSPRLTAPRFRRWRAARAAVVAALPLALLALAFATGSSAAVRKSAAAHTGLGGPLATLLRRLVDLDRDGHAAILGGGDCDDLDARVHPGAIDLPDDGIDQNCLGGDLRLTLATHDPRFVPVPATVPADTNILFVTIDTLRADHVGAYDYARPTTPVLDALAAKGTLFANAWAHAPSTRYSIPALLTGRHPSQVAWDTSVWWPALLDENRTLAEVLHDRGLFTGAILNYHYFDRLRRMDQGFDTYDNANARLHQGRDPASTSGSSAREQADAAIGWLDAHGAKRFFLWLHFYDPHFRYERHAGVPDFGSDPPALYDHEIRYTDGELGRVLEHLRARGLDEKTAVVVLSDHGEGFGEHGIDFHGYHLYAAQTKVPLIMRVPGFAPRRVTLPVGHIDLLPTLANLVGAAPEPTMQGRSLLGELAGLAPDDTDRQIFQEVSFEGNHERRGVVTRRWHLLFNQSPDNTWELYDLANDPTEQHDLWDTHEGEVASLRDSLLAWLDAASYPAGAAAKLAAALLTAPPTPRRAVRADLGDAARLLGADLADEIRAGDELAVTLYFESRARLAGDFIVFLHFEGPGRFQGDHVPAGGAHPVANWRPGQLIADRHTVRVPGHTRPGEYRVFAGLWSRAKNQNLAVHNAGAHAATPDRIALGTIRVVP